MSSSNSGLRRRKLSTVILAAGVGKRMYSKTPKILHRILGKPIILFVIEQAEEIKSDEIILVVGKNAKQVKKEIGTRVKYALQPIPLGTGDAAKKGIETAKNDRILILCGDVPLLEPTTLIRLIDYHQRKKADLTLLTCHLERPFGYGRILRDRKKRVRAIIEQADASVQEQRIKEVNAGVYYGEKTVLLSYLNKIDTCNQQGEFYLTDVVKEMLKEKKKVVGLKIDSPWEITGINSKLQLAEAREFVKRKWFAQLMARGVYIEDPATTVIDLSVEIGKFVHIRPHTLIEGDTKIRDGITIEPFTWIKNGKKVKYKKHV